MSGHKIKKAKNQNQNLFSPPPFPFLVCLVILLIIITQLEPSYGKSEKKAGKPGRTSKSEDSGGAKGQNQKNQDQGNKQEEGTCPNDKSTCCNKNGTSGNNTDGCPLQTKLLLVQVIFRHGDRTPLFSYPNDPHKNASGIPMLKSKRKGLLTKRGKMQAYELGTFVATRYKSFLDGMWLPEDILVQSSMSERAIMTAQTCLAGMFVPYCTDGPQHPEGTGLGCEKRWSREIKWQPIPVYPIPAEMDNKLRFQPERCPAYQDELNKVLGCDQMQEYVEQYEHVFSHVKNNTGLDHVDIRNLGQVYDTLFIQDLYELELPEWTAEVYPEPMKSIEEFGFQVLSGTKQMIRLNGGPLVRQVILNMKQVTRELIQRNCPKRKKTKKQRQKRLYLFAGHDTTVSAFLSALNVFEIHQPPYASAVIIELHQEVTTDELEEEQNHPERPPQSVAKGKQVSMHDFIVKVFYRNSTKGSPQEMILPDCGNPCYLDKLESAMREIMITDLEWKMECHGLNTWFGWLIQPFSRFASWFAGILKDMWKNTGSCGMKS